MTLRLPKYPLIIALLLCALQAAAQGLTASRVFADAPLEVIDMIRPSARLDMIDYWEQADSLVAVQDALGGNSRLEEVAPDYLRVSVTPVSTLEIKLLPLKADTVVMTLYTVGRRGPDSRIAADTDVRFFDRRLNPLPPSKFLRMPRASDFFSLKGSEISEKQLAGMLPFEAVALSTGPGDSPLIADLTSLAVLPEESRDMLAPLLRQRSLIWNGSKFSLTKQQPGEIRRTDSKK